MLEMKAPVQTMAKDRCRSGRSGETLVEPEERETAVTGTTVRPARPRGTARPASPAAPRSRLEETNLRGMSSHRDLFELTGERPALERPFLVMHLAGWTDAGMAGQTATTFLRARWNARTLGEFDSDELIDYRARRPIVRLASGSIEALTWTPIQLLHSTTVEGGRDALMLVGPEPDLRWRAFADRVVQICQELGVTEVFGLGAFPAPALHSDPVLVVSTSADPDLAGRLPTVPIVVDLAAGVQSVLEERLHRAGIPAMGVWARVPPYLAGGGHPPAALELIRNLARLAGVTVDTTELEAASKEHLEQVEQAIRERPQIAEFVDQIRGMVEEGAEQQLPSGDEIAAELERFLSQQPPDDDPRA
jgi:predicted ATP-grasp superfamily ATP-dependent carboligase